MDRLTESSNGLKTPGLRVPKTQDLDDVIGPLGGLDHLVIAAGLPLRRGVGLATFMHGCGFTGSGEVYLASLCKVRVAADGVVEICTANTEIGQGMETVFTGIAADALGLTAADVRVIQADTAQVPNSGPTVASRTSMVVGHLVAKACDDLVRGLESNGQIGRAHV